MTGRRYVKEVASNIYWGMKRLRRKTQKPSLTSSGKWPSPKENSELKGGVQLTIMEKFELLHMIHRSVPDLMLFGRFLVILNPVP